MNRAPVTVIIPTYNRADTIRDAVDSALAQTLPPAQVVVIDDGSQDDTSELLRDYAGKIVYHRQPNSGISVTRNTGARLSTEPFIALLDSDDVWHPRKLELQMRVMEQHPQLGMLGTAEFDWPAAVFPSVPADAAAPLIWLTWDHLVLRTSLLTSSILIRRSLFDQIGGFDSTMARCEDRDLFLRVAEVAQVAQLKLPLLGYRDTPGSASKQAASCEAAMRRILAVLDERKAWHGRWLLRLKAYSLMHQTCCDVQARAGNHAGAVKRAVLAMAYYPLPYGRKDVRLRFDRPKRLAVNVLRLLHLKAPDPGAAAKPPPPTNPLWAMRNAIGGTA